MQRSSLLCNLIRSNRWKIGASAFLAFFVMAVLLEIPSHLMNGQFAKCTIATCFDLHNVAPLEQDGILTFYIYKTPPEKQYRMNEMSAFYAAVLKYMRANFAEVEPENAMVFLTDWDSSCPGNSCFQEGADDMGAALRALPYWNNGRNHLLFEVSDWHWRHWFRGVAPYDSGEAVILKSGPNADWHRAGFDFSIPLTAIQRYNDNGDYDSRDETCVAPPMSDMAQRDVLVFFKGQITNPIREELIKLHDNSTVLIVHSSDPLFDFRTTLRRSRFGLAPAGLGLHSYRLIEAMMHGAIPVVIAPDDNTILPFDTLVDWNEFSVTIAHRDLMRLPVILASVPLERLQQMQRRLSVAYVRLFCTTEVILRNIFGDLKKRLVTQYRLIYPDAVTSVPA